ncbi:DUF5033 domain-containing protein [Bacteroides sp.]|uniref:DUF5033 domain-containing protein n=1 Tax=Bacteroides sp. TaxID=29523 RepID=UPI002FC90748
MKTFYYFVVLIGLLSFTACENSDDISDTDSSFELIKKKYGIEVLYDTEHISKIPAVSTEEMKGVLEAVRINSNVYHECLKGSIVSNFLNGMNANTKSLKMPVQYQTSTRTGSTANNFILCVQLNYEVENDNVYYYGTDYTYSSTLFYWHINGFSLSLTKDSGDHSYTFTSQSYLYFKVHDQENCLVRVPVVFQGQYEFKLEKGSYRFQLGV